jgi:hypothetical protein
MPNIIEGLAGLVKCNGWRDWYEVTSRVWTLNDSIDLFSRPIFGLSRLRSGCGRVSTEERPSAEDLDRQRIPRLCLALLAARCPSGFDQRADHRCAHLLVAKVARRLAICAVRGDTPRRWSLFCQNTFRLADGDRLMRLHRSRFSDARLGHASVDALQHRLLAGEQYPTGSIGGTALEAVIAIANAATILRMFLVQRKDNAGLKQEAAVPHD